MGGSRLVGSTVLQKYDLSQIKIYQISNLFHPETIPRPLCCFKDTKNYRLINIKPFETKKINLNVFVNRHWKKNNRKL